MNATRFDELREAKKSETLFRDARARDSERTSSQAALHGCLPADELRRKLGQAVHTRDKPVVLRERVAREHAQFVSVKKKEREKNGSEDPPLQGGDAGSG